MTDQREELPARLRLVASLMRKLHFSTKSIDAVLSAADEIERLRAEVAALRSTASDPTP